MRVITRADWDGLVCAALLSMVEQVDSIKFIEPGPFQAGEMDVTDSDIIANLPYRKGCGMWFDHHATNVTSDQFKGAWKIAPSAARVISDYYGTEKFKSFTRLIDDTDIIDSAQLTTEMVQEPKGYVLLSMTVEGKRFQDEPYWLKLIEMIKQYDPTAILADKEVEQRCGEYMMNNEEYGQAIDLYSDMEKNVLVTDLRRVWHGEPGNRFLAYTLYPHCDIWVKAQDHPNDPERSHISVGHSIFNRTSPIHVGNLLAKFGGGGHKGAGSCRPLKSDSDKVLREIVEACKHD